MARQLFPVVETVKFISGTQFALPQMNLTSADAIKNVAKVFANMFTRGRFYENSFGIATFRISGVPAWNMEQRTAALCDSLSSVFRMKIDGQTVFNILTRVDVTTGSACLIDVSETAKLAGELANFDVDLALRSSSVNDDNKSSDSPRTLVLKSARTRYKKIYSDVDAWLNKVLMLELKSVTLADDSIRKQVLIYACIRSVLLTLIPIMMPHNEAETDPYLGETRKTVKTLSNTFATVNSHSLYELFDSSKRESMLKDAFTSSAYGPYIRKLMDALNPHSGDTTVVNGYQVTSQARLQRVADAALESIPEVADAASAGANLSVVLPQLDHWIDVYNVFSIFGASDANAAQVGNSINPDHVKAASEQFRRVAPEWLKDWPRPKGTVRVDIDYATVVRDFETFVSSYKPTLNLIGKFITNFYNASTAGGEEYMPRVVMHDAHIDGRLTSYGLKVLDPMRDNYRVDTVAFTVSSDGSSIVPDTLKSKREIDIPTEQYCYNADNIKTANGTLPVVAALLKDPDDSELPDDFANIWKLSRRDLLVSAVDLDYKQFIVRYSDVLTVIKPALSAADNQVRLVSHVEEDKDPDDETSVTLQTELFGDYASVSTPVEVPVAEATLLDYLFSVTGFEAVRGGLTVTDRTQASGIDVNKFANARFTYLRKNSGVSLKKVAFRPETWIVRQDAAVQRSIDQMNKIDAASSYSSLHQYINVIDSHESELFNKVEKHSVQIGRFVKFTFPIPKAYISARNKKALVDQRSIKCGKLTITNARFGQLFPADWIVAEREIDLASNYLAFRDAPTIGGFGATRYTTDSDDVINGLVFMKPWFRKFYTNNAEANDGVVIYNADGVTSASKLFMPAGISIASPLMAAAWAIHYLRFMSAFQRTDYAESVINDALALATFIDNTFVGDALINNDVDMVTELRLSGVARWHDVSRAITAICKDGYQLTKGQQLGDFFKQIESKQIKPSDTGVMKSNALKSLTILTNYLCNAKEKPEAIGQWQPHCGTLTDVFDAVTHGRKLYTYDPCIVTQVADFDLSMVLDPQTAMYHQQLSTMMALERDFLNYYLLAALSGNPTAPYTFKEPDNDSDPSNDPSDPVRDGLTIFMPEPSKPDADGTESGETNESDGSDGSGGSDESNDSDESDKSDESGKAHTAAPEGKIEGNDAETKDSKQTPTNPDELFVSIVPALSSKVSFTQFRGMCQRGNDKNFLPVSSTVSASELVKFRQSGVLLTKTRFHDVVTVCVSVQQASKLENTTGVLSRSEIVDDLVTLKLTTDPAGVAALIKLYSDNNSEDSSDE
jgi:hypothetical protein